uniref:endo-polygalacturonase n=1 Tax=Apolygus lucorum TaxID=248454 RepID=A0A060CUP6_APOLU|nr:polygalacturonase PG3-1 [Apolygus lucorum]
MTSRMIAFGGLFFLILQGALGFDVSTMEQLEQAKKTGQKLVTVRNLQVPAGKTLDFQGLPNGTTIEFAGRVTFGYKEWNGPLMIIKGGNFIVKGLKGHVIDGEGQRWWDGLGGITGGKTKPAPFIYMQLENSFVNDLVFKNAPMTVMAINACRNLIMNNIDIDNALGHTKGGHNTDGFDVAHSENVRITNSRVNNQDDCLALSSGKNIVFANNECRGGHGIAVIGGFDGDNVEDILIKDCKVINNNIGVRVKTILGGKGYVKRVTFDNVELKDVSEIGVVVIGNYYGNNGPKGEPTKGCPITNLVMNNIHGNVLNNGTKHWVYVAEGSDWTWNTNIQGGNRPWQPCKGIPKGLNIECGTNKVG